jgi:hypothetical protein
MYRRTTCGSYRTRNPNSSVVKTDGSRAVMRAVSQIAECQNRESVGGATFSYFRRLKLKDMARRMRGRRPRGLYHPGLIWRRDGPGRFRRRRPAATAFLTASETAL